MIFLTASFIISNSDIGVIINRTSNDNTIESNKIQYSSRYGILVNDSSRNNVIRENNLVENEENAYFNLSFPNFWFGNYWDDWEKVLPRPIYGEIILERLDDKVVPWVQFDWKPAREPYDIII